MDRTTFERYFKTNTKGEVIFTGDELKIYIPKRYEEKQFTQITSEISTLGIFRMVANGKDEIKFLLPAFIKIRPSGIDTETIGDDRYAVATLVKNDVFMVTNEVLQTEKIAYLIWNEFIYWGNTPSWMTYLDVMNMFRTIQKVTGLKFGVPPVVFEILISHLARTKRSLDEEYRLTDMHEYPAFIPLHAVAHAATSVSARMIGSYFDDSVNVSLIQEEGKPSELENILRQ